jgi:hypothetical protein
MKKVALVALLAVLVPLQAKALETNELLGLVAMPLAVAAASDVTGVPVADLSHFVATLNRAQVPPTQVVQVVRYAPAALVFEVENQQPAFVQYIDSEVDRGVTGSRLVTVIENRYRTYDLEPQFVVLEEPATTYVVRDDYIPDYVVARVAEYRPTYAVGDTNDLLALTAMPLAVAAVADITGIPFGDLSSLVASLNAARMPPLQVVEVLRYSPVVMVDAYERPRFVQFVNTQVVSGVRGPRLIEVIGDRFVTYDVTPRFRTVQPREVVNFVDNDDFFPAVVTSRVAEVRAHPHGGPPGQLKKERGLQTGAEVVHGATRRTVDTPTRVSARRQSSDDRPVVQKQSKRRAERRADATARREDRREEKRVAQPKAERAPKVERQVQQPKHDRAERGKGGGHSGESKGKGKGKGKG